MVRIILAWHGSAVSGSAVGAGRNIGGVAAHKIERSNMLEVL